MAAPGVSLAATLRSIGRHPPGRLRQERSRADPVLLDRRHRMDRFRCLPSDRQGGLRQGDRRRARMAELRGTAKRAAGGEMRMSMAEVFVMRDGRIAERRAWVIE